MATARAPGESREPWVKFKVGLRRSDKVGQLPNAAARWGWTCVLLEAKTQRRMGIFGSRRHLRDLLGTEGRYVADFIAVGLAHEVPNWCAGGRCRTDYPDAKGGEVVVHDYRREQRDPTNADRQAAHRGRLHAGDQGDADDSDGLWNGATSDGDVTGDVTEAVTANVTDRVTPDVTEGVTPDVTEGVTPDVTEGVTPGVTHHSRARGTTVTVTTTTRDREEVPLGPIPARASGNHSNEPRLTKAELDAWAGYDRAEWKAFKAAWMARGFKLPPKGTEGDDQGDSMRSMLWQIARDWPGPLGVWVQEAPGHTSRQVISHVLARFHEARDDGGVDDAEWAQVKEAERGSAKAAMTRLSDALGKVAEPKAMEVLRRG